MRPLRVGVVGLGLVSRFYLSAIQGQPSVRLASVSDQEEAALAAHRAYVACYRDHRAMLSATALDAVVVAVPNDAHFVVCHDVLSSGLPVCVEKPLAVTLDQGRRLTHLAATRGLPLFTAFHRRYNENFRGLVRGLAGRPPIESVVIRCLARIGEHVRGDRWYLDRCGGGCVAGLGPSAFDLARILLGPLTVSDADIAWDTRGIDRRATILLWAAAGASARIELDWSFPGERADVAVRLADGTALYADLLGGYPRSKGSLWHEYDRVVHDFVRVVTTGGQCGPDGLAALSLVDEVYRGTRVDA